MSNFGHPDSCGCVPSEELKIAEEIYRLRSALEVIARKRKMDAVAAASMRAIALAALSSSQSETP